MKAVVGAKKEFIDAYIAQLYKSFKVKQVQENNEPHDKPEMSVRKKMEAAIAKHFGYTQDDFADMTFADIESIYLDDLGLPDFRKSQKVNEAAKKWNAKENFKTVSLSFLERYDLESNEIDGNDVLVAYDQKDVVGVWYRKARVGTFNQHSQASDIVEFTESDPHYPYD